MSRIISISSLKKGDVVWECVQGTNIRLEIQSDPRRINELGTRGWYCSAKNDKGDTIDLFVADEYPHGPRLYHQPVYLSREFNEK